MKIDFIKEKNMLVLSNTDSKYAVFVKGDDLLRLWKKMIEIGFPENDYLQFNQEGKEG